MKKNRLLLCYSLNLGVTKMMLSCAIFAMIALIGSAAWAQPAPVRVKGKVTDPKGETLIGVTVKASDGAATSTDADGTYSIQVSPQGSLTFTYLGYNASVVKVNGRTTVNAALNSNNQQLTEVVVVGYGTQRRKDVTGAITHINLEDSPKEQVAYINPLEALQGTPGINIGPTTAAGGTPIIQVRGQNSINASTSPLIVLDGVIFNGNLSEINMNDVATYDVLKDASSSAIYGSRSANGVVLITTKRGKTDKPVISFNAYYGSQSWTRQPEMRTGQDYIQWRQDLAASKGSPTDIASVFQQSPLELQAINSGQTINWLKDVQQYAPIENYNLSVSGSTPKTNYYVSAGYTVQDGVLANDNYSKPNLSTKIESNITDWLTFGVEGFYSERKYDGNAANLYMATYLSPYSYKYIPGSNNQLLERYPQGSASNFNPYWDNPSNGTMGPIDDNMERYTSTRGIAYLMVKIPSIPGLSYKFDATGSRTTSDIANFHHENAEVNTLLPSNVANPSQFLSNAYGNKSANLNGSFVLDNLLTYTHEFGKSHLDALIGYTRDDSNTQGLMATGSNFGAFGTSSLSWYGLNSATTQQVLSTNTEVANAGYIGRLNYNYASKYFATFNFRRDAYSAFAPGHKFGNFPGASIAWAPSAEDFMKDVNWLDNLKLRASYGRTGNQGIQPYTTQSTVTTANNYTVFGSTSTGYSYPSQLGNVNLSWETTTALNFGLDFSIYKGRLSGTIDVYRSQTTNQLQQQILPIFGGYSIVQSNLGQVDNKGIEVDLNSVNIKSANGFTWSTSYGFWMNRNKLVHLTGVINPLTGVENDNTANNLFIGKSLGSVFDYTAIGIVQASDKAYMAANAAVPGDVMFKDINGDGKITTADRSIIGNSKPNFNMNLTNSFAYKNFSLSFTVNAVLGGNGYDIATNIRDLDPGQVTIGNWLNLPYWTAANPENKYPRPNYGNPLSYGFYQNAGFARLQYATLGYTLPKNITDKFKISNLKLYVSGTNLFTITGWTGLDPANAGQIGGNGGSTNTSTDANGLPIINPSLPIMRSVTFGINASF